MVGSVRWSAVDPLQLARCPECLALVWESMLP